MKKNRFRVILIALFALTFIVMIRRTADSEARVVQLVNNEFYDGDLNYRVDKIHDETTLKSDVEDYSNFDSEQKDKTSGESENDVAYFERHGELVKDFYDRRKIFNFSEVGEILFLNKTRPEPKDHNYIILMWKRGPALERRHIYNFGTVKHDPFGTCAVKNCKITYQDENLDTADAVIFHLQHLQNLPEAGPNRAKQRWIFLTDESPYHTFMSGSRDRWKGYADSFNWSMTYRVETDVPVPYGRATALAEPQPPNKLVSKIPNWDKKRKDVLIAILISNCSGERLKYLQELQEHINVHVYGHCAKDKNFANACKGHFGDDCDRMNDYLFYLAFENGQCDQYMTEKLFWSAYGKGSIPIIFGPKTKMTKVLLPEFSYLHTKDFSKPADLARYVLALNKTVDSLLEYHKWRLSFQVLNEHGYFKSQSFHYCRVCEALNYNDESIKVYNLEDLSNFLDPIKNC